MFSRWLGNLMLWQRFLILGVIGLCLVGPPLYLYVSITNAAIDASEQELQGIAPGKTVLQLLQQVQQHRGLSAAFLGANQLGDKRQAKQQEAEATLATLEQQLGGDPSLKAMMAQVRTDWSALSKGVSSHAMPVPESYTRHTALCQYLLKVLEGIADQYGLSLDPDADTYYLMRSAYFDSAALTEMLGETRAKGAGILATKQIDSNARALMSGLSANAASYNEQTTRTLGKAFDANARLKDKLGSLLGDAEKSAKAAIELSKAKVIAPDAPDYPAPDYIAFFTQAIDTQFKLIGITIDQLDSLIQARIAKQRTTRNGLVTIVMVISLLAGLVAWAIARSIERPIQQALCAVKSIAQGDLSTPIPPGDHSEIGQMLIALDQMQDALRQTLRSMLQSADAVSHSASAMADSSHEVSLASASQSESSSSMAAAVEQLTVSINHVTHNATDAQHAASDAEGLARNSAKVVHGAAGGIRDVATELRGAAQVIAELGEQSQRISSIVSVIHEVADQTNLLALNAAIEAARAGEVGRGFAVVADEVRKLAERTNAATQEISNMIALIQDRTAASVRGVNSAVGLVDGSVAQADEAVDAIEHISSNAVVVEEAIDIISAALTEQANASQHIAVNVEKIAQASEQNSASASMSDHAAQALMKLADQMRTEVARFRLE